MNRSTSHLFWLLPLGVVACLLAMIYMPHSLLAPLWRLLPLVSSSHAIQRFMLSTLYLVIPCVVVGVPVAIAAIWLARREGGGAFIPSCGPRPDAATRITDVLILAGMGVPLLAVIATVPSNHGMLLHLDELPPSAARIHVVVAMMASIFVLASLIVAARGRGLAATLLMATVLSVYGVVLNGPGDPIEKLAPSRRAQAAPPRSLIVNVWGCNVPGADLWVNGVYLSKLPCEIPLDEFFAKVPVWTGTVPKPGGNNTKHIGSYRQPLEAPESEAGQWMSTIVPDVKGDPSGASAPPIFDKYYARIRYAGEWALARGGASSDGGDDAFCSYIEVRFEHREERLARLFNQARMQNYRVGPDWFTAIETYGHDGWLGLRKEGLTDPAMLGVFDDWARWRYRLNDVHDTDGAWRAFQTICDEADRRQMYVTADVAGRAVELLVPMLAPASLISQAEGLLADCGNVGLFGGELFRQLVLGRVERPARFNWPLAGALGFSEIGGGGGALPTRGLAVAHAVWRLDKLLDEKGSKHPNTVEARIAPALIRRDRRNELFTRAAVELGGPDVETFLLRHDWRAPVGIGTGSSWDDEVRIHGREVNRWLYLLAHLRGPTGDGFRAANAQEVMALAEVMVDRDFDLKPPTFLFYDLQNGQRSLAAQFWPRYRSTAVGNSGSRTETALACQFDYLVKMDPVSTPEMYIECWRAFRGGSYETSEAISRLKLLPPDRRRAVLDALTQEVRRDVSNFPRDHDSQTEDERRKRLLSYLQIRDEPRADDKTIQEMIASLNGKDAEKNRRDMSDWLEHKCPTHAVIPALARSSDPSLRVVCLGALRSHPTPAHRAILNSLLKDPDQDVRAAAEKVRDDLARLASTPLSELVSDPTATRPS